MIPQGISFAVRTPADVEANSLPTTPEYLPSKQSHAAPTQPIAPTLGNTTQPTTLTLGNSQIIEPPEVRWFALAAVLIAMLLVSTQSASLIIAFPDLLVDLDANLVSILWVLIAFMIAIATFVVPLGKISDILGRRRVFACGFVIFSAASLLCAFAQKSQKGWDLVAYRILQGVGSAALFANSSAILTDVFLRYNQLGLALGWLQVVNAFGSMIGPLLGGALHANWNWIFLINVPIGFAGAVISFARLRELPRAQHETVSQRLRQFDWIGCLLFFSGFCMFLIALVATALKGQVSPSAVIVLYVVGVALIAALVVYDVRMTTRPLIQFRIFGATAFTLAQFCGLLTAFSRGLVLFSTIFLFQGPYAHTPFMAGVLTLPFGGGILVSSYKAGALTDKYGPKVFQVIGPLVAGLGSLGIGFIRSSVSIAGPLVLIFVIGFGFGLYNSPNSLAGMVSVPTMYRGNASSIQTMFTMFGLILALIALFGILTQTVPMTVLVTLFLYGGGGEGMEEATTALHECFFLCCALALVSALIHFTYNFVILRFLPPQKQSPPVSSEPVYTSTTIFPPKHPASIERSNSTPFNITPRPHIERSSSAPLMTSSHTSRMGTSGEASG